jgi:hypothetical protein
LATASNGEKTDEFLSFFNNAAHDRQFAPIILLPVGDFNLEITLISVSINFLFLNNRL